MSKLLVVLLLALLALAVPLVRAQDSNDALAAEMEQWMESAEEPTLMEVDSSADSEVEADVSAEAEAEAEADVARAEAEAQAEVEETMMAEITALTEIQAELEAVSEAEASAMTEKKRFKLKKLAKKIGAKLKKVGKKVKAAVKKAGKKVKNAVKKAGRKIKKAVKKIVRKIMCWWKGGRKYCGGKMPPGATPAPIDAPAVQPTPTPAPHTPGKKPKLPPVKPLLTAEQLNARWETESAKKIATLTAPKIEYYHEVQNIDGKEVDRTARAIIDTPERAAYRQRVKDDIRYAKTVSSATSLKKTTDAFLPKKKAGKK